MKTITVNTSKPYPVHIGEGLLSQAGAYIRTVSSGKKAALISDSNVFPLYGSALSQRLQEAGFQVVSCIFCAGEARKNAGTYLEILNFLAENQITRSDVIVALGGGVTGDMAGFAAATFLRGVDYVQIPTSLLAMVDSSVGGKTAIDLDAGKNLVGAFYQPKLVLCDTGVLSTLTDTFFRDGCAEVIKYAMLFDEELFGHLAAFDLKFQREYVISRCVELKARVVEQDEFDKGQRQLLNFGHTVGHAIEKESKYSLSHGYAVAAGMAVVTKASYINGLCQEAIYHKLCTLLEAFSLPTDCTYTANALYTSVLSDKKRFNEIVNIIIPRQVGICEIYPLEISKLKAFIEEGLIL